MFYLVETESISFYYIEIWTPVNFNQQYKFKVFFNTELKIYIKHNISANWNIDMIAVKWYP